MNKILPLVIILLSAFSLSSQERTCGTMEHLNYLNSNDSQLRDRMQKNEIKIEKWIKDNANKSITVITIPVVVHVVWNTNSENISDNQVLSQITILNEDFRRLNTDERGDLLGDFAANDKILSIFIVSYSFGRA